MRGLEVPYAADAQGTLADPSSALKGQAYRCLLCQQPVILKRGGTRAPHFAHLASADCASESVTHLAAKMRLRDTLNASLANPEAKCTVLLGCPGWEDARCVNRPCSAVIAHDLPLPPYDRAVLEQPYGDYRLDVALLNEGEVVAAFEVYYAHRVGERKACGLGLPWYEVGAKAVLENPRALRPLNAGTSAVRCKNCQRAHAAHALKRQHYLEERRSVQEGVRRAQLEGARELVPVMRFTHSYLIKHEVDPAALAGTQLIVKRCVNPYCRRALVLIDTREWVPHYPKLRRLLSPFKPKGSARPVLVNTCPYCQRLQGRDSFEEGDFERFSAYRFLEWLARNRPAP